MKLTGNTILITGGTSGIGLAFAEAFLKMNNIVIVCGRREERLKKLKIKYPELITYKANIADSAERINLKNNILKDHPDLNVLINNAGVQLALDLKKEIQLERIKQETDTNFVAPVHLTSLFIAHLLSNSNSYIINISSGLAFVPIAFMPVYCATKAAIHSYTISLRHQLKGTTVKVFEIAPPAVDTELGHDRRSDPNESHGGLAVGEFLSEAIKALKDDIYEAPVVGAKILKSKGMEAFNSLNNY